MLVVWLIITLWVGTMSDEIEKIEITEQVEFIDTDDYIFMDGEMYSHLIGDTCPCSSCSENKDYEEEDWDDDEYDESEDDLD